MKLSLFLLMSVLASTAFACPDLSGTFSCAVEDNGGPTILTIKQSKDSSGFTVFEQTLVTARGEEIKKVITDGKLLTNKFDGMSIIESYKCTDKELINENLNIYNPRETVDRIEKVNKRWFLKKNTDLVIETSFELMGVDHKPDVWSLLCRRQ